MNEKTISFKEHLISFAVVMIIVLAIGLPIEILNSSIEKQKVQIEGTVERVVARGDSLYVDINDEVYEISSSYSDNNCQFIKENDDVKLTVRPQNKMIYNCEYK